MFVHSPSASNYDVVERCFDESLCWIPPTCTLIKLVAEVVVSVVRSLRDCRIKVSIAVPSDNNNHLQEALPHDVAGGCCDPYQK